MTEPLYDVAIAGAGLTGQLMALTLSSQGFHVALIGDAPDPRAVEADPRTTAIAYGSSRLFRRLGIWAPLEAAAGPIRDILVTNGAPKDRFRAGGVGGGRLHFPGALLPAAEQPDGAHALGFIVPNGEMTRALSAAVAEAAGIDVFGGTVGTVQDKRGMVTVTRSAGDELSAHLLLVCDGKGSRLRARLGYRTLSWQYGQKALAFNVRHSRPHHGVAHEVFYPDGPFAILPLSGNMSSIVWTEKGGRAEALGALPRAALLEALRGRMGQGFGDLEIVTTPKVFPLSFVYAPGPVRGRTALAGDAYHGIHPIAGQGFNLAIKDIAVMADVLSEARATGLDIGAPDVLARYATWRRFDVSAIAFGTDALTRLFSNDIAPVRWARGMGLGAVNHVDAARKFFMRQAGADFGSLPSMMAPL